MEVFSPGYFHAIYMSYGFNLYHAKYVVLCGHGKLNMYNWVTLFILSSLKGLNEEK